MDFDYLALKDFHTTYHLWEDHHKDYMLTDMIEIHFIEMPKFLKLKNKDIKGNSLHRWLTFFDGSLPSEALEELMEMDQAIKSAEKKLEYLSSDPEFVEFYKARQESILEREMIYSAKSEGKEEGLKKGIDLGRKEGIDLGKIEVARKFLAMGMDLKMVAEGTGLNLDELKKLQQEMKN